MKTLLRTLLYFSLIVWIGAEIFFPIVAAITFGTLVPDARIRRERSLASSMRILHGMGLVSGMVALAVLALAPAWAIYKPRAVLAPMTLLIVMIAGTAYSQYSIIPAMERDRIAAGGAIDTSDPSNPTTIHFNKLHRRSEHVEGVILLLGFSDGNAGGMGGVDAGLRASQRRTRNNGP